MPDTRANYIPLENHQWHKGSISKSCSRLEYRKRVLKRIYTSSSLLVVVCDLVMRGVNIMTALFFLFFLLESEMHHGENGQ
jgi:hypothetical protein